MQNHYMISTAVGLIAAIIDKGSLLKKAVYCQLEIGLPKLI